MIWGDTHKIDN